MQKEALIVTVFVGVGVSSQVNPLTVLDGDRGVLNIDEVIGIELSVVVKPPAQVAQPFVPREVLEAGNLLRFLLPCFHAGGVTVQRRKEWVEKGTQQETLQGLLVFSRQLEVLFGVVVPEVLNHIPEGVCAPTLHLNTGYEEEGQKWKTNRRNHKII